MKYIKLILILLFLSSCSTNKSVVGLYGKCGKSYFACTQIELKSDNTFQYFIFYDVGGGSLLKGTWKRISNDTVVMNTYNQPEFPKTTYVGKINPDLNGEIKIQITDKNGSLGYASVEINDKKQGKATDENGVAKFKTDSIKNIHYNFLGQNETIEIDNPKYNEIEITVRDLDLNAVPRFLTDKIMTIDKNKLFFNDGYSLKKTRLKNRQWK